MHDRIQTKSHFHDLIDTPHLIDENDRLPGPNGVPGAGLTVREAVPLCELWWEKARFSMPDFGKDPHEQVIKSGINMGLPWFNLTKQEMLRVLAQWYAHVAVPTMLLGQGTSQDEADVAAMDDIRVKGTEVFDVLDTKSTHDPTRKTGIDEDATWQKEYEQIDLEDKLVNEQGEQLQSKRKNDG